MLNFQIIVLFNFLSSQSDLLRVVLTDQVFWKYLLFSQLQLKETAEDSKITSTCLLLAITTPTFSVSVPMSVPWSSLPMNCLAPELSSSASIQSQQVWWQYLLLSISDNNYQVAYLFKIKRSTFMWQKMGLPLSLAQILGSELTTVTRCLRQNSTCTCLTRIIFIDSNKGGYSA